MVQCLTIPERSRSIPPTGEDWKTRLNYNETAIGALASVFFLAGGVASLHTADRLPVPEEGLEVADVFGIAYFAPFFKMLRNKNDENSIFIESIPPVLIGGLFLRNFGSGTIGAGLWAAVHTGAFLLYDSGWTKGIYSKLGIRDRRT